MFKRTLAIILAVTMALAFGGCTKLGLQKPASVCDTLAPGESILCDLAKQMDVNLEMTGQVFAALNAEAVIAGEYSMEEALKGIAEIRALGTAAAGRIDLATLGKEAEAMISRHPLLSLGAQAIVLQLKYRGAGVFFKPRDGDFWNYWCDSLEAQLAVVK